MLLVDLSKTKEDILLHEQEINLWEMANLRPKDTGVNNYVIWISSGEGVRPGPRIKITKGIKWDSVNNATIPLTGLSRIIGDIGVTQQDFSEIIKWIDLNKKVLIQFWNSKLSTQEILSILRKI